MAIPELPKVGDYQDWTLAPESSQLGRVAITLWKFARRKPLGAVCGLIVITFMIVGDLVPESLNKLSREVGTGEHPMPYVMDILVENVGFIHPFDEIDLRARLQGSSSNHLLGTDSIGRDVFSRLLYGARTAVIVSFGAMIVAGVLNVLISVPAGFYGGWYDKLMYRIVDVVEALPSLVILLVILGLFGSGLWQMVFVIGVLSGFGGRPLRGQTISLIQSPYVEAARVVGASDLRIMMRYVLPNLMALIIVAATFRLGIFVLLEASLSFLGFGLPPPFPSWGQMLSLDGREHMRDLPGLAIYPGLAIGLLVFSFNLFGDALRDVLDPRLRGSR